MTLTQEQIQQIQNYLRDNQPILKSTNTTRKTIFDGTHFQDWKLNQLRNWINRLNDDLGWGSLTTNERDGRKLSGIYKRHLVRVLNEHRVYEILFVVDGGIPTIEPNTIDRIVSYITSLRQQKEDNEFFKNFNREQYKHFDAIDEITRDNVRIRFDERLERERLERERRKQQKKDNNFFNNFNREQYKQTDKLDRKQHDDVRIMFD